MKCLLIQHVEFNADQQQQVVGSTLNRIYTGWVVEFRWARATVASTVVFQGTHHVVRDLEPRNLLAEQDDTSTYPETQPFPLAF